MYLTVGEISDALGMSTEMIRFYVREGMIKPRKNEENNYWEYSSEDVMYLSDILFYRNMNLTVKDIKIIFGGLAVEDIWGVMQSRKKDALENALKYLKILDDLHEWEEWYHEELNLIGKYKIGNMPAELRKEGYYDGEDHIARYIKDGIKFNRKDWLHVSISFFCNIFEDPMQMRKYLSVNKTKQTEALNNMDGVIEEESKHCLYTEVHYSENVKEMLDPLIAYARESGCELNGEVYGRENTNYYVDGKRCGLYRIYALMK